MRKLDQCPRAKMNAVHCTCTYTGCPKHGMCCECLHHHRERGELPACYFAPAEERTYNRSIAFYIERYGK